MVDEYVLEVWDEPNAGRGECGDFFFVMQEGGLPVLQAADLVKEFKVLREQTAVLAVSLSNWRW